jgi:hypothetical protein|tara:strand:- start:2196 stop:2390 length:195 start_codon:yes stop_codon:yes gene_type:complete
LAVPLLLLKKLPFQLLDQTADQILKFRLASAKCRFMADRFIPHAEIRQHQLQRINPGVGVHAGR